jgi:MoxR-like ATPase
MDDVLSILQALAAPIIAVAGATIAWQQKRLADIRLRTELFDRRFKIYETVREHLENAAIHRQNGSVEYALAFSRAINEAAFFFSPEIVVYLEEIDNKIRALPKGNWGLEDEAAAAEAQALRQWCDAQIKQKLFFEKFKPEMELKTPIRFW